MYKVTAQARPRVHAGQQFNDYWAAGKHWSGSEPKTHELDDEGVAEMKKQVSGGFPIKIISIEEITPESEVVESATVPETQLAPLEVEPPPVIIPPPPPPLEVAPPISPPWIQPPTT